MDARDVGLFNKFSVARIDGTDAPGEKHHGCDYFILDMTHDQHAIPAVLAYAESCKVDYPVLASDLFKKVSATVLAENQFITVPETTLPNGTVVPSFQVGQYLASHGPADVPQINAASEPWTEINYHDARKACDGAGYKLLTELQALAIAHDIANQDINWTGGKVGEGSLYQGLHKDTVSEAQPGDFESPDPEERRWHQLSNGERIYDFAGNAFNWIFDDVQGDENGLVAKAFAADSPSLTTAPFASMTKGTGWRPDAGANWSGHALMRGGCWCSEAYAGVFYLSNDWPGRDYGSVGFRCTK